MEDHHWNYRTVGLAPDQEAALSQALSKVFCIERQLLQLVLSQSGTSLAHNDLNCSQALLDDGNRHALGIGGRVAFAAQTGNQSLGSCNVATSSAKALCECAHEHIHTAWIDAKVVAHSPATWTHGTDGMGFIQVQI